MLRRQKQPADLSLIELRSIQVSLHPTTKISSRIVKSLLAGAAVYIWLRLFWAGFSIIYLTSHAVRAVVQLCSAAGSLLHFREMVRWPHKKIQIA
jgi:hypothetical protein